MTFKTCPEPIQHFNQSDFWVEFLVSGTTQFNFLLGSFKKWINNFSEPSFSKFPELDRVIELNKLLASLKNLNEVKISVFEDPEDDDGAGAAVADVQELAVRVDLDLGRVLQTRLKDFTKVFKKHFFITWNQIPKKFFFDYYN